ncbi:helix-turn-helix domain-containing protein [Polyangium sp. 15x6]|uniref:helix-turn-helix domain-containing protein n=1 Tax=Polyangium sp. 15x6 TaxID=3042687 RepID=UPI00249AE021|nr:helix-turn-helix domain-containing protein [Polyangium sp. 15x6]MDI3284669.1 helix-turn-helix domain-containing protein [Polyangium sp. 15x6]
MHVPLSRPRRDPRPAGRRRGQCDAGHDERRAAPARLNAKANQRRNWISSARPPTVGHVDAIERRRIDEALVRCAGNQTCATGILGISRRTLVGRLSAYGMPRLRRKG